MQIIKKIKQYRLLKQFLIWTLQPKYRPRPRMWVKLLLNPLFHKRKLGSFISSFSRMDVFPYNKFELGRNATIEDFSCVNNALGDVVVGDKSRVGLSTTIIGPVSIGANVNIAQNVVASGLNHGYEDVNLPPREQKCTTSLIQIEDDCWIGANVVITSGVCIGKHCVIAAGSVVTKSFPAYSVIAGNPAKRIKHYDFDKRQWVRTSNSELINLKNAS